jgi:phosphoribosylformylglycinamidine cyclo-ligase
LFFLDYFACGRLYVSVAARVIAGIAAGCEQSGCALIGGETAEMPDMYPDGEYDLAGFAVGVVEREQIIDGRSIRAGDALIGLASSGAHSNGYSLIRRVLERSFGALEPAHLKHDFHGRPFSEVLLAPTRLYVRPVLDLIRTMPVKGLAHITGGGLIENVPRMLPEGLAARIERDRWALPPLFSWLQQEGGIDQHELFRVFNCGIGMVIAVDPAHADAAMAHLERAGEQVWRVGEVVARAPDGAATLIV